MNVEIREIIKEALGSMLFIDIYEINDDYDLFLIGIDSLNLVQLIFALEEKYEIVFDEDMIDVDRFKTINEIIKTISVVKERINVQNNIG
ncbi:phosphopantetheine-binding protein [Paenibacillus tengchongensis]|uniref:phosphopantetheine-binding protein n=1 Tax=Paenibacillus tengchongensis TaxID=2608684 RepID=UPI00124C75B8|nr:phosphopantetheine-binding protein [Paenibacillus tengchongensis]